jgi:putative transcriptional regulator
MKNIKLKLARVEKDLTQEQLAERVEAGKYNPSIKLCIAICKELGKTLNDIFWEE